MKNSLGISIQEKEIRLAVIDEEGRIIKKTFLQLYSHEPEIIWQSVLAGIKDVSEGRPGGSEITSCGVSSPEDWFLAADSAGNPLCSLAYGPDPGLAEELKQVTEHAVKLTGKSGFRFNSSSALPKILALKQKNHEIFKKTRKFIPVSGFITGKLSGEYFTAAPSFGPGLGFDGVSFSWHRFIKELGILPEALPKIVRHGEAAGMVASSEAVKAGIGPDAYIIAPASNDMCLFLSSGAINPGQWNSCMGEQLVLNGVSSEIKKDPVSRIHYNELQEGSWTAEARTFTGENCLPEKLRGENFRNFMDSAAESNLLIFPPPASDGAVLPFTPGDDQGFIIGKPETDSNLFSGYVEGMAYIEKWTFEVLEALGFDNPDEVFATGSVSPGALQIRADITEKKYVLPAEPSPEFGMAVLGLLKTSYPAIAEAAEAAVRPGKSFEPGQSGGCREKYRKFRRACRAVGYE